MRYFILEDAFIVAEVVAAPEIYDAFYDRPFYPAEDRAEFLATAYSEGMWDANRWATEEQLLRTPEGRQALDRFRKGRDDEYEQAVRDRLAASMRQWLLDAGDEEGAVADLSLELLVARQAMIDEARTAPD
jgi:hypothetical protein